MRQICVNKPFSFPLPCLSFRSPFGHTSFLRSFALTLSQCRFLQCLSLFVWWIRYIKNWKEAWFPSLSSPSIPLTNLVWCYPSLTLAHHRPRQVSPISKVKPLHVSWRAAMVLTRLSLYATLPACLRGWHLKGTDHGSVTLFLSPTVLPECYHQMFWAAATLATWKHTLCDRDRESGEPKKQREAEMIFGGAFFKASHNAVCVVDQGKQGHFNVRLLQC